MEFSRAAHVPGFLEVNAPLIEEQAGHRGLIDRAGAESSAARALHAAAAVLAVSEEMAGYLESRYPFTRGRVQVVSNGVNPDRFPENRKPACPGSPGSFTVGFLGTLKPWHGLPVLVEAFARLCRPGLETRLLLVGDGPERRRLEDDLAARGLLSSARFTGAVSHGEVPGLLASMDVAAAPYPRSDFFYFSPLKVYEYMAAGLAVAASRIGEVERLIQDGHNGLLCPAGDPQALAGALERLRADAELRSRLGRAARRTVLEHHTWQAVARRILALARPRPAGKTCGAEAR
jgi:glycosyltransferase involved in cell wall biosynthesis